MSDRWVKKAADKKVFKFDWAPLRNGSGDSDWLDSSTSPVETISSYALSIESPGPTVTSDSLNDNSSAVLVTLSGGTLGQVYDISCQITTSTGQTDTRTAKLTIVDRY